MCVQEFASDENVFSRDTAVFDSLADFMLIAIDQGGVDVSVAVLQGECDGCPDLAGFRLPRACRLGQNANARRIRAD